MSNITISYWRTFDEDEYTHLAFGQADQTICGYDLAGDDLIHSTPPERVRTRRITCDHCLAIIEAAIEHRRGLGVTPVDDDHDDASVEARWG